jgi:hypothetical protein
MNTFGALAIISMAKVRIVSSVGISESIDPEKLYGPEPK